ncbi:MAG: AraC family transcriptional regulator [Kiritimatiellia bacterium]|jgi:AraC-like DNA-binding protein
MGSIKSIGAGRLTVGPEWSAKRHSHGVSEMMVMLGGKLAVRIGEEQLTAGAGDVLFYPPRTPHEEHGAGANQVDFIFFGFKGKLNGQPYMIHDSNGRIRLLAAWLLEEQSSMYERKRDVMHAVLGNLLAEAVKARTGKPDDRVASVRAFMRERIAEALTVTEIAAHANMSRAHFIRTYKRLTGRTPMADLRILRVETARDLLIARGEPLKTIASKVGFCDESHLSRVFHRHFHVPPGYFRKD